MEVDIYTSDKDATHYLVVPHGQKPHTVVPSAELAEFGKPLPLIWQTSADAPESMGIVGLDANHMRRSVQEHGYFFHQRP